jgi:hypothetical protein
MGPRCSSAETQVCHRSYIIADMVTPKAIKSVFVVGLAEKYMLFKVSNNLVQIYRSFSITGNYGRRSFSKYDIFYYDVYDKRHK